MRYSTWQLLRDLAPSLKPHSGNIFFSSLLRVVGDILLLYPAFALATVVNVLAAYVPGQSVQVLWNVFLLFCGVIVVQHILHFISKMLMYKASEQIKLDLRLASMAHVFRLDIGWHEGENTGNKLKKINRGSENTNKVLRIWVSQVLPIAVSLVGSLIIIAQFNRVIALSTLLFLVSYFALARFFRTQAARATVAANNQEEHVEGLLFESLNNIRTVKVLGMARVLMKRLGYESKDLFGKIMTRIWWFQTGGYSRGGYAQLFQVGMLAVITVGILQGHYEVGFLVLFNSYFSKLLGSITELTEVAQEYSVAKISIARMFEILKEPVRIDSHEKKLSFPLGWKKITFQNVSFGYGSNLVLDGVSFEISRGEKVGIVGLSGAGKSTLFKLLLKEYESYDGEILIDDVPLRDINRQDYFAHTAVVLQDTEVFNFSLKENITLANQQEQDNPGLLKKALQVAYVDDFVRRLPEGVHTLIGEKGIRLSGGERQRVGIARAVFKDPELLLLDEATSHLDIESEEKIRLSLHTFFDTVTAVVIAHRLTTIKEMDIILVLENGKITEKGNFEELYRQKGRFHELWEKQRL